MITKFFILHLIFAAHLEITPQTLSSPPLVSPETHQQLGRFLQKRQIQQLEEKLNGTQKDYEQEQQELQSLPSSRLECFHRFPPVAGSEERFMLSPLANSFLEF